MTSSDFADFYAAVHKGRRPFPWQERLAARILNGGGWPETIAIPTACGKTSVIDVAVFSLAAQAGLPMANRTAPLRIFFVVDRRLVVDDVSRHARNLADEIGQSTSEAVARVREGLLRFGSVRPLEVATLRGGMYRSDTWADAPNQPLVCVSTVDQIGSRLLFRGYGVSDLRRPVDTGLVGNDSLVILDEAHLSQPFLDTLGWVSKYQEDGWVEQRVAACLQAVSMSATVRKGDEAFKLDEIDQASALKDRLEAVKTAELKEAGNLEQAAHAEATRFANAGAGVIGVILNTVASARKTFELLREAGNDAILLTGRIRPYDRDRLVGDHLDRIETDRERKAGERFFVVATQTVEVGADLDFDALVTEAAPLDALRQRFGRLDRIGQNKATQAVILKLKRAKDREWIYGEALDNAWKWLNEHAVEEQGRTVIDFGVRKMSELFEQQGNASLNTAGEAGPLMFPAHVDAWVQTSPKPSADPDVAPFLHGTKALQSSDVQVVWRADLTGKLDEDEWIDALSAAPPVSTEAMPLPIGLARKWLRGQVGQATDVEGGSDEPNGEERGDTTRQFLIWRGPEESLQGVPDNLRPGDTIVVRSEEGGSDQWGWNPDSRFVQDIGDVCANDRARAGLGRLRIRLHPSVVFPDGGANRQELTDLLDRAAEDDEEALEAAKRLAAEAVIDGEELDGWRWGEYGGHWLIGLSPWQKEKPCRRVEAPPEEAEDSLTHRMSLREHTDGVIRWAKGFTQKCGMPAEASASIELAAKLHDAGKCDDRFQMLLDPYRSPAEEPLAKGKPAASAAAFRRRREWAEYPKGARHELASVAMTDGYSEWPEDCDRELVLYLIGTHHGYARPLPPVWSEDRPETLIHAPGFSVAIKAARAVELAGLGSGWVDRFWSLTRKYGWWGLAYLEAILRRADCMRSREEEEGK